MSNTDFDFTRKSAVFAAIVALYLILTLAFYFRQRQKAAGVLSNAGQTVFSEIVEEKLSILEEASEFFSGSLKSADMFRLISSRVNELIPFATCALVLAVEKKANLKIAYVTGENSTQLKNLMVPPAEGLAGKVFAKRKAMFERKLEADRKAIPSAALRGLKSSIAVPLRRGTEVFGVLQFYGATENCFDENSLLLIEAVGERIAPLLLSSMAFESSLLGAMTDTLTELPNERAFYMVLENQIAEAQRLTEKRQLTVLVIDIADFTQMNQKYGHSTGDKIIAFAAKAIKNQLRKMDFLARSANDEFFTVLPTATGEITEDIIKRIERAFVLDAFEISSQEKLHLRLNFGTATFIKDGELADQLLRTALLRKQQGKFKQANNKILWFPKEFVN